MKTNITSVSTLVCILCIIVPVCAIDEKDTEEAETTTPLNLWWIILGEGISTGGMSMYLSFSYNWYSLPRLLLTARLYAAGFPNIFTGEFFVLEADYGLLMGVLRKTEHGYISVSTGFSYFDYESERTVGIPFEAQAFLTGFRWLGFGVVVFANVNSISIAWGGVVCLRFGRLRN